MGSTRLPAKVLADVHGRPMLARVIDRARLIEGIDDVVLAIPDLAEDDRLASAAAELDVSAVRGSADDVLSRYVDAAAASDADAVVRITADCPLLSPRVSSEVVAALTDGEVDYASNTLERTYPRGLDTEAMRVAVLREAEREAVRPADREHVTPFIWSRPDRFRLRSIRAPVDRSAMRWTVDEPADLALVRTVYEELDTDAFEMEDVLALLDRRPEIAALNAAVAQKPIG